MRIERTRPKALFLLGISGVAIFPALLVMLGRAGRSSDLTDFALGALVGVSTGLLVLAILAARRVCGER